MDPFIVGGLISGGLSGLGSYFGGDSAAKAAEEQRKAQERMAQMQLDYDRNTRAAATKALSGYGYNPYGATYQKFAPTNYTSPYEARRSSVLGQFLSGGISPAQQALLNQERARGMEDIRTMAAGSGTPMGGRLSLAQRMAENIALKAAGMADENVKYGMSALLPYEQMGMQQFQRNQDISREEAARGYEYGLQDWIRKQQAGMQGQELRARYAYA